MKEGNQVVCKTMEYSIQMGPHMEPILSEGCSFMMWIHRVFGAFGPCLTFMVNTYGMYYARQSSHCSTFQPYIPSIGQEKKGHWLPLKVVSTLKHGLNI
jgi:hypothetical protein